MGDAETVESNNDVEDPDNDPSKDVSADTYLVTQIASKGRANLGNDKCLVGLEGNRCTVQGCYLLTWNTGQTTLDASSREYLSINRGDGSRTGSQFGLIRKAKLRPKKNCSSLCEAIFDNAIIRFPKKGEREWLWCTVLIILYFDYMVIDLFDLV